AVVVDDIDMNITHVIRGEDHIANTAKQILLYEAFGATLPAFAHTPLILNQAGQKLSKRDGVTSIFEFQKLGFTAEALTNYMTLLGWSPPDAEELFTLPHAAEKFGFDRVNKAGAKFDWDKLDWINSQYLHALPPETLLEAVLPYWQEAGYAFDLENDRNWLLPLAALIGPSLTRLPDSVEQAHFFFSEILPYSSAAKAQMQQPGAAEVVQTAVDAIASETSLSSPADVKALADQVAKAQGVKKGLVMKTLRAALMGDMQGPDLAESWVILHQRGFDVARLKAALGLVEG
ncbi:MAG: glutamate--tRNA ligase, partial [Cyanobacteria bacterium Co-bin8]|nr:glutamate--tRNA ligase [Cyanobacteria bacterium Co-bin8]